MTRTPAQDRAVNKAQYERRKKLGLCRGCGSQRKNRRPVKGKALCSVCLSRKLGYWENNKSKSLEYNLRYKKKLRDEVFAAYGGPVCSCCKESHEEFLTVDHINGDGADHRRAIGKATQQLYLWLRRNGFPSGFRILCMNCNFSIGMRGYCPHEKEATLEKFGVDEGVDQEALEKKAAQGCPKCGSNKVERHGSILICPHCGTEPFEEEKHQ